MSISRRNLLIGSGSVIALGACRGPKPDCPPFPSPSFRPKDFDEGWNRGDRPWENQYTTGHGQHGPLVPFRTKQICLVYMDVTSKPFGLDVARFHFDNTTDTSTWEGVEGEIIKLIDILNARPAFPSAPAMPKDPPWDLLGDNKYKYWLGLNDFAFKHQHHVIIYFKTKGMDINEQHPVWFGATLQGKVLNHGDDEKKADWNYTFYGAARKTVVLTHKPAEWADAVIYMRNHYQKRVGTGYAAMSNISTPPDRRVYSMNINVVTRTKVGNLEVPIIIDPDTGNMGEGQP